MVLLGPWTARQCCVGIGCVYPLYKSSRALRRQDKEEMLQWITFWSVNAFFWAFEMVGDTIIGWLPLYYEAKIVFLLWLVLPSYHGARELHRKWLAPTFQQHEEVIDLTILQMKRRASEKVMEMCREGAVLAMRRGSGVVAQSQQYVTAQLVQQALGKLQTPPGSTSESQETRLPAVLTTLITTAITTSVTSVTTTSEPKEAPKPPRMSRTGVLVPVPVVEETNEEEETEGLKSSPKAQEKRTERKSSKADKPQLEKPSKAKSADDKPESPKKSAATARQEKSKELVTHFKKLLVKGFQLKYYPSEGVVKHRMLRLDHAQSRFLVFESASSTIDTSPPKKTKCVKLFIHNARRIAAGLSDSDVETLGWAAMSDDLDTNLLFQLDNGKTTLLFEAESQKTRDLLVAGMRLLINEHKRQDTAALTTITMLHDKLRKQEAFDRLLYSVTHPDNN